MAWIGSHSGWGSRDSIGLVAKIVLWYCAAMEIAILLPVGIRTARHSWEMEFIS